MAKNKNKVISTKEWVIINLVMLIPIVNIIMLIVWAFGDNTNLNKANWAKASIIVWVIGFLFYFIIIILSITFIMSLINNMYDLFYI